MEEKREDQRDRGDRCGGKDDVDDKLLGQEGAVWLVSGASSDGAYYGELRVAVHRVLEESSSLVWQLKQ